MINYNKLLNNLETLKLEKMLNYLPNYLDSIKGQDVSIVDVLYNLTEQEIQYRDERASRIQVTVNVSGLLSELIEKEDRDGRSMSIREFEIKLTC